MFSLVLIMALFRCLGKRIPTSNIPYTTDDALSIISERYARGEINKNDYVSLRKGILN